MPKWDSTEAPVSTCVDDPDDYSGHQADNVAVSRSELGFKEVQTSMSPAEAYHFADDLQAAADACWGAAEYVVNAVLDGREVYAGTIKAPAPDEAVRRICDLRREQAGDADPPSVVFADEYRVYRADSMNTVRTDSDDDN